MKELLQLLLYQCISRDFKTMCSDGTIRYTGMCSIVDDIHEEGLLSQEEKQLLKEFLANNKPADADDAHWYVSTPEGNSKRIKFLENHI